MLEATPRRLPAFGTWLVLTIAYSVITAIMVGPFVNYSALGSASYEGDARLIVWTLAWDNHAVLSRLPLFDSNIFYPAPQSLAFNEHLFGLSLFTLPIYAATGNPVAAYNLVWLLSFLLNALAAHLMLKRYAGSHLAAFAGSLVYTFSFYKMLHAHGHLHLVWTWLLPLSLVLLERWAERPSLPRATLWAAAVVLQSLTSWYLAVMTSIAHVVLVAWMAPGWIRARRLRQSWHLVLVTLISVAALLPFAKPYRALPDSSVTEASAYSADLAAYLVPPENTWPGRVWRAQVGRGPRWIWGERTLFLGWIALALAIAGIVELFRRSRWQLCFAYASLTLVAFALSLGPPAGADAGSWNVFSALASMPGVGAFRAPARFALLVILGLSVLAAFGANMLDRATVQTRILLLAAIPVMLSEWYVVGFPGGKPSPFMVPAIYHVDAIRSAQAIVSLPDYRGTPAWFKGADYLYFSTAHWRPIVNGFGRAEPADYSHVISHMNAFPGPNNANTMRRLGVEYVVLHAARLQGGGEDVERSVLSTGEYDLVSRIGSDYLFKVRPTAPPGTVR